MYTRLKQITERIIVELFNTSLEGLQRNMVILTYQLNLLGPQEESVKRLGTMLLIIATKLMGRRMIMSSVFPHVNGMPWAIIYVMI